MKKLALLFVFVQSLVFANDPVITLNGDSVIEIYMGSTFVDPGATAYDEEDGVISNSIQVSGSVDTNTHGTYVLAYNVTDSDGNSASVVVRTINVVDDAKPSIDVKIFYLYDGSHTDPDLVDPGNRIEYFIELWNTGNTDLNEFEINNLVATDLNGNSVPLTSGPSWGGGNDIEGYSYPGEMHLYIATLHISETTYGSGGVNLVAYGHGSGQFQGVSLARDLTLSFGSTSDEIILDGQISANNNQIKKVADPTDNLDAVNKRYVDQRTLEQTIPGQNIGDLLYWNGQSWQKLSAPQEQSTLRFCEGQLTWGPCKVKLFLEEREAGSDYGYVEVLVVSNGSFISEVGLYVSTTNQMPNENDITHYENESLDFDKSFTFSASPNTTYFVRAYAINNESLEKSYSEVITITTASEDQNGNTIYSKTYGNQEWSTQNADVTTYRDGTPIPEVAYNDHSAFYGATTGVYMQTDYGKFYNWYAIMGIHDDDLSTPNKQFAPEGWHVPSRSEWETLRDYLIANGYNYDGTTAGNKIAKAMASDWDWSEDDSLGAVGTNQSSNNSSEFNAIPFGEISGDGVHFNYGISATFWTRTYDFNNYGQFFSLNNNSPSLNMNTSYLFGRGHSVRFVKD